METIKLYDEDAYRSHFTAKVLSCEKGLFQKKEAYEVLLDKTVFFPEEGGQSADSGTIGGIRVLDVKIKGNVITHILEAPLIVGEEYAGEIDFSERFSKMQQHTGEHIFSGLVRKHYGFQNVGFHLNAVETTMDYDGLLSKDEAAMLENETNHVIWANIPVTTGYPPREVLEKLDYRSKIDIDGPIRIVAIEGVDICACCAPHVRETGEVGLFKIAAMENYKGGVRIHALCGERALLDYRRKQKNNEEISVLLSAKPDETAAAVKRELAEMERLRKAKGVCERKYVTLLADSISGRKESIILFEDSLDPVPQRELTNTLVKKTEGVCMTLVGNRENGYRYIMSSLHMDVRPLNQKFLEHFGARGGGNTKMVQGQVRGSEEEIREWFGRMDETVYRKL